MNTDSTTETTPRAAAAPGYVIDAGRWDEAQEHEIAFWNKAGSFDHEIQRVQLRYGPILGEIDAGLDDQARILDLGCGPTCPGRLFRHGAKTFLDPLMSEYERRWPDKMPRGERLTGRGEAIPHDDATFDVVVSFNALDHMFEPWDVLTEIKRVMKPGGVFVLGIFCHPPIFAYPRLAIEKILPFLKDTPHPFSFTRGSIERFISKYFHVEEARCVYTKPSLIPALHRTDWVFVLKHPTA